MSHSTNTAKATIGSATFDSRVTANAIRHNTVNRSEGTPLTLANLAQASAMANSSRTQQHTLATDRWLGNGDDPFTTGMRPARPASNLQALAATDPLAAELNAM